MVETAVSNVEREHVLSDVERTDKGEQVRITARLNPSVNNILRYQISIKRACIVR